MFEIEEVIRSGRNANADVCDDASNGEANSGGERAVDRRVADLNRAEIGIR